MESGKLPENEARKYFQQLIHAVDYCHSRGVYHRDLKVRQNKEFRELKRFKTSGSHGCVSISSMHVYQPENLLLDVNGNLKVSDFGLSALSQQHQVRVSKCTSALKCGDMTVNMECYNNVRKIYEMW
mgnify:CR=1 FL=1